MVDPHQIRDRQQRIKRTLRFGFGKNAIRGAGFLRKTKRPESTTPDAGDVIDIDPAPVGGDVCAAKSIRKAIRYARAARILVKIPPHAGDVPPPQFGDEYISGRLELLGNEKTDLLHVSASGIGNIAEGQQQNSGALVRAGCHCTGLRLAFGSVVFFRAVTAPCGDGGIRQPQFLCVLIDRLAAYRVDHDL